MNLISNASEAIGDGIGEISVSTGVSDLTRASLAEYFLGKDLPEGKYVYLEVADTGCGVKKEIMKKIFDPYFSTKFTGRGLGLAVVLGIVRAHNGALDVQSEFGSGTVFRVFFPASKKPTRHEIQVTETKHDWKGEGKVLIVDDEDIVIDLSTKMLEELGFSVLVAKNGREGIETFRRHSEEIDFVLLDMTMPELSGMETFGELRSIKADARILLTSGYSIREFSIPLDDESGVAFLEKPYKLENLIEKIRQII